MGVPGGVGVRRGGVIVAGGVGGNGGIVASGVGRGDSVGRSEIERNTKAAAEPYGALRMNSTPAINASKIAIIVEWRRCHDAKRLGDMKDSLSSIRAKNSDIMGPVYSAAIGTASA